MRKLVSSIAMLAVVLGAATSALAWSPKLAVNDDVWAQVGLLGQLQFEAVEDGSGSKDDWSNDFFIRRARLMVQGSVHKNVKFFFSTDVPNAGKSRVKDSNDIILNDLFVDLQFMPEFNVAMGRILSPFSPEYRASAALLLGIDYNLGANKLMTPNDRAFWRDDGIEVRGLLFDGLIDYRVGLFRGERESGTTGINRDDNMRTTGMVMINLADAQPGFFYNMNSLGALKVLSFGGGYDYVGNSNAEDGKAWNLFALLEQPLGPGRIVASAAYYDWDGPNYGRSTTNGVTTFFEGNTISAQAGYLLPCPFLEGAKIQPVVRYQHQDNDNTDVKLDTFNIGLNYFLKGQNINFKVDYAINDQIINGEKVDAFRFQTQLLF